MTGFEKLVKEYEGKEQLAKAGKLAGIMKDALLVSAAISEDFPTWEDEKRERVAIQIAVSLNA